MCVCMSIGFTGVRAQAVGARAGAARAAARGGRVRGGRRGALGQPAPRAPARRRALCHTPGIHRMGKG